MTARAPRRARAAIVLRLGGRRPPAPASDVRQAVLRGRNAPTERAHGVTGRASAPPVRAAALPGARRAPREGIA